MRVLLDRVNEKKMIEKASISRNIQKTKFMVASKRIDLNVRLIAATNMVKQLSIENSMNHPSNFQFLDIPISR